MQIVKLDTLIDISAPLKVATALGEPVLKLNPIVQSLRVADGGDVTNLFADGSGLESDLTFTKRGTNAAKYVLVNGVPAIHFPQTSYGSSYKPPQNKNITFVIEFDTVTTGPSRVLSTGTAATVMLGITATSSSLTLTLPSGTSVYLSSAYNSSGKNKIVAFFGQNESKIICNGVEFTAGSGWFTAASTVFILNGASAVSNPTNEHRIYNMEIYEGYNHTLNDLKNYAS